MKLICAVITLSLISSPGLADFATPLADEPVGTNASGRITLVATNTAGGATNYMANIFTDSGPRSYPVVLPPDVDPVKFIGKECMIEAVIEKDDTSIWKRRFRITKIELKNQNKNE